MWNTDSALSAPEVLYGTDPNSLTMSATGNTSYTYYAYELCGSPANVTGARTFMDPGWFSDVKMSGLQPSTKYYYKVSGSQPNQYSDVFSFTTRQVPAATENLLFYVYGDMGEGASLIPEAKYTAQNVLGAIQETGGFVMHIGDISYARSIGWVWEVFFNLIESIAANFPYMVDVGNHE